MALAALLATLGLDAGRVHLIDAFPRDRPTNFLFRSNNPVNQSSDSAIFDLAYVTGVLRSRAQAECGVTLPDTFTVYDLDLENPTDPGYFAETSFWKQHPSFGALGTPQLPGVWTTLGSLIRPSHVSASKRDHYVREGSWAIGGHGDHLEARLNATYALLRDVGSSPKVIFAHCNAGCDRTGEFIGAYGMTFLGYNVTTAYGEACRQCGRCPNYYATSALGWWCLTLAARGAGHLGDCLDFAGCRFLGSCDAHGATPLPDACPTAAAAIDANTTPSRRMERASQ